MPLAATTLGRVESERGGDQVAAHDPARVGAHPHHQAPAAVTDLARDTRLDDRPPSERHLTPFNLFLVVSSVSIAACGQLLLRHGMRLATATPGRLAANAATSLWVWGGLAVFGVSAILWLWALSRVPLSIAYPFNALGFIGILTASAVVLGEHVSLQTWIGCLLVVGGLLLVVTGATSTG